MSVFVEVPKSRPLLAEKVEKLVEPTDPDRYFDAFNLEYWPGAARSTVYRI